MSSPHQIYIGYDSEQDIAYEVLSYSLQKHASEPLEIHKIDAAELTDFNRPVDPLHRFTPIPDEMIGDISAEWNQLDQISDECKLLHYTSGGPWLAGCEDADHADLWHRYREEYEAARAGAGAG